MHVNSRNLIFLSCLIPLKVHEPVYFFCCHKIDILFVKCHHLQIIDYSWTRFVLIQFDATKTSIKQPQQKIVDKWLFNSSFCVSFSLKWDLWINWEGKKSFVQHVIDWILFIRLLTCWPRCAHCQWNEKLKWLFMFKWKSNH